MRKLVTLIALFFLFASHGAEAGICDWFLTMTGITRLATPAAPKPVVLTLEQQLDFLRIAGITPAEIAQYRNIPVPLTTEEHALIFDFLNAYYVTGEGENVRDDLLNRVVVKIIGKLDLVMPRELRNPSRTSSRLEANKFNFNVNDPPTQGQQDRAQRLGLPLITGGRDYEAFGSHSRGPGFGQPFVNGGVAIFTDSKGKKWVSMLPYDHTSLEEVMRFYGELAATPTKDFLVAPVGIHFVRGIPRLIFPAVPGKHPSSWTDLKPQAVAQLKAILVPEFFQSLQAQARPFGSRVFENEYLFIQRSGELRMALPVRPGLVIEAFDKGKMFAMAHEH